MNTKPVIGLLGSIGSGKSAVALAFSNLGCAVIDADKMALELLCHQDIIDAIKSLFGSEVLNYDGMVDRAKLAEKVFSNEASLEQLTTIIHPPVLRQAEQLLEQYVTAPGVPAIVLDVPLLMETGWHTRCDKLVFVETSPEICRQRVIQKRHFSRFNFQ
jgi:dephospho-CoA kinase